MEGEAVSIGAATMNGSSSPVIGGGEGSMNNSDGFSSKGLSDFKPGIEHHDKPVIDINHGKKSESLFKDPKELNQHKPLVDISNPIKENPVVPHEFQASKPQNSNPIVDINHGKKETSLFKNTSQFHNEKPLIDISKPVVGNPIVPHIPEDHSFQKYEPKREIDIRRGIEHVPELHESVVSHKSETPKVSEKPQQSPQILTQMAEGKPLTVSTPEPEVRTEPEQVNESQPELQTVKSPTIQPEVSIKTKTETYVETQAQTQTESEIQKDLQTAKVTEIATEKASQKVLAPELARETKISLKEAKIAIKKAVRKALLKKEKTPETDKKKKLTIEEKAKELFQNRKKEIDEEKEYQSQQKPEVLYFEKDKKVNVYREMVTTLAAQRLREEGAELTGSNLAHAISGNILQGDGSEIVEGLQDDLSANNVINEISKVGTISDNQTLHRVVREITDRYTAIRLSFHKRTDARKEDAEQVYGKSLDSVGANLLEDKSTGELVEEENGEVVYIQGKVYEGYTVESV